MILQLNRNSKVIIFELLNSYLDKQTLLYNSKFDLRGQELLEFKTRSIRNDNLIIDFFSITACPQNEVPNALNTGCDGKSPDMFFKLYFTVLPMLLRFNHM